MHVWLLSAAAGQAAAISNSGDGMSGLAAIEVARLATTRALDLRLSQDMATPVPLSLIRGMVVQRGIAPNAAVGLGLANLYDRRSGFDVRDDGRPKRSRKPAVTFLLKF